MTRPTPAMLPAPLSLDEVDEHRDFDCAHYDHCVDVADRAALPDGKPPGSWSCRGCRIGRFADVAPPEFDAPALITRERPVGVHNGVSDRVLEVVNEFPPALEFCARDVAVRCGDPRYLVGKVLARFAGMGVLLRVGRGRYRVNDAANRLHTSRSAGGVTQTQEAT